MNLLEWALFGIPFWVHAIILLVLAGGAYLVACQLFGAARVNRYILPVLGAIGVLAIASKIRQSGWKAKEERDRRDAEKFKQEATEIRDRAEQRVADETEKGTIDDNPHGRFRD